MAARTRRRTARRRTRRNAPKTVVRYARTVRSNPPRRRRRAATSTARRSIRRRYRRNPPTLAGLNLKEMAAGGGAIIANAMIEKQILPLIPASWAGGTGRWAAKVGSAAVTWQAAKALMGRRVGDVVALVLGGNLLADAAYDMVPSLTMAGYTGRGVAGYTGRGLSAYPGMGRVMPGPTPGRRGLPAMNPGVAALDTNERLSAHF